MTEERWDYVIVGSGFGGSVSALRLVEKGYRVLMLEQGRRLGPADFPKTNWNLRRWLWMPKLGWRGLFKMTFLRHVTSAHTDVPPPQFWDPVDPEVAMRGGEPLLAVLVHPRHWRADPVINARDDARRIVEGVQHRLPRLRHDSPR